MSVCLILDVTESVSWPALYWLPRENRLNQPSRIPPDKRATVLQPNRKVAEAEALRLANAHPGHRFAVFEVAALAYQIDVPTHVNLNGFTLVTGKVGAVVPISDELPF